MNSAEDYYREFLSGNKDSFGQITALYFYSVLYFVLGYVHDFHTAEDITSDCFCELIIHKHRYNFKFSLKSYLFMLAKSKSIDHLRKKKVIDFVELDDEDGIKDEKELEEIIIDSERKRLLHNALESLPQDMKEAVYLVYFENFSYKETAKIMKKSEKQIDNLIYRAKEKLKAELRKEGLF